MDRKEQVFLQAIFTLSLGIFIYLYTPSNPYFIAVDLGFSLFLIYNIKNLIQKKNILKPYLLLILIISFLIFALNGLGNQIAPQTFEKIDKSINKKHIELKFKDNTHINRVCYYFGVNRNINFRIGLLE